MMSFVPPGLHVLPGERVLWSGTPVQGIALTAQDALMVPFSLLWGGFAIFWNVTVWTSGAPVFFRLWGLPFLAVGLYMIAGRFFYDAWVRSRTRYAVTDRRVVILRGDTVRSLDIDRLPPVEMAERGDGSGTLYFGERPSPFIRNGFASWSPALSATPQFTGIPDVRAVYTLVTRGRG